jgi:uncharacterized iron-regulated membrane protein
MRSRNRARRLEERMRDLAVQTLANGGHGGGRIMILVVLLLIIVALVVGWVLYARRTRRNQRQAGLR